MTHYMKLKPHPFLLIASKMKTIELRLLDEKRRKIEVGDTLIFENAEDLSSKISCVVKKLHIFGNFEELYDCLPLEKCGYLPYEVETASFKDMEEYYSVDEQKRFGVVGIEIELI